MCEDRRWSCGLMDKALVFGTKDCRLESCQDQCPRQLLGLSVSAALHVVSKLSTGACSLCRAAQPIAEICDSAALIGARSNCSRGANHRLRLCRCSWQLVGLSVSGALHTVRKLSTGTCSLCRAAQPRAEICDSAALMGARSNCSRGADHRLRLCRCSWRQAGAALCVQNLTCGMQHANV